MARRTRVAAPAFPTPSRKPSTGGGNSFLIMGPSPSSSKPGPKQNLNEASSFAIQDFVDTSMSISGSLNGW
jgi:hypothetical protein